MITEARDFFYPNFSLLKNHAQDIAQALKTQHTEIVEAVERLKIPPITGNSPAELIANEGVFRRNQALDDVLQAITQPTN